MSLIPGLGIVRGMALTFRKMFEPKATIRYPEQPADVAGGVRIERHAARSHLPGDHLDLFVQAGVHILENLELQNRRGGAIQERREEAHRELRRRFRAIRFFEAG